MFRFLQKQHKVGNIIKFRSRTGNIVVAKIVEDCGYTPKWGRMLAVEIYGTKYIHHIWVRQTEILQITDGEAMLWKLENS